MLRRKPEPEPAGECVVCRGQLVPDCRTEPFTSSAVIGTPIRRHRDGWFCENCGLRYHHLPSRPPEPKKN
ncbi:MAG TPA: hypothetical protein VMU12_02030 [Candidatus Paceibacterota bacterium]|nr:hypothetical protein [Candidatus Paceibacterota bacterium]